MLLLFMVPLPILGITPVTVMAGVEFTTATVVAAAFTEMGSIALLCWATDPGDATAEECVVLLIEFASDECEAAGAAGERFGNKRRPKDGEKVFLRPLTAKVRESCIHKQSRAKNKKVGQLKFGGKRAADLYHQRQRSGWMSELHTWT
jgi:hypothetical protein